MSASESTKISPRALAVHAVTYGGSAGLLAGIWMIIEFSQGWLTDRADIGRYSTSVGLVFPVGGFILGLMIWRNKMFGGTFSFVKAMGPALAIGLAYTIAITAVSWAHATFIDRTVPQKMIAAQAEAARKAGYPADEVAKWETASLQYATADVYAVRQVFTPTLIKMLVIALATAAIVPKRSPQAMEALAKN